MAKNGTDDTTTADATARRRSHNGASNASASDSDQTQPLQARAMGAMRGAPDAVRQTATAVAEKAPDAVRQTANVVAEHAPEAIAASQSAVAEATRRIQDSSTEQLTGWAAFALGLWLGLMLGRVPRLLSLVAGLPALVLAGALVARRGGMRIVSE